MHKWLRALDLPPWPPTSIYSFVEPSQNALTSMHFKWVSCDHLHSEYVETLPFHDWFFLLNKGTSVMQLTQMNRILKLNWMFWVCKKFFNRSLPKYIHSPMAMAISLTESQLKWTLTILEWVLTRFRWNKDNSFHPFLTNRGLYSVTGC